MALNTPHNVTLTEGQIGIILCSLEKYFKGVKDTKEVDSIFEELEGTIDRHYDKIEKAKSKQPYMEW